MERKYKRTSCGINLRVSYLGDTEYVNLADVEWNYTTLQKTNDIAIHILVFFWLHSILNPFKFRLTNFATSEVTAFQISPLFWKAVSISESNE